MKRKIKQTAILASVFLSVLGSLQTSQAQESSNRSQLETLFTEAVAADGKSYITLRKEILANKDATSFLSEKSNATNLLSRVIGRAMLSWQTDLATNIWRNDHIVASLAVMLGSAASPLRKIQSELNDVKRPVDALIVPSKDTSAILLLEIALKGPTRGVDEKYGLWVRCLAAGLAGTYPDPDVPPMLAVLAKNGSPYSIRACAVTGLRKTKSSQAIEPLIDALSDENKDVQEAAKYGLKELTGQDFGTDQAKYRDWWLKNKEQFQKKP